MEVKNFIGIDVSKLTLDVSVVVDAKQLIHQKIMNNTKDIKSSLLKIMKDVKATFEDTVFCMEYTGVYNLPLVKWLHENKARIWMESAVQIIKSTGITRGKNDKVDSFRIAMYAFGNRHKMKLWNNPKPILRTLAALLSQRTRLIKAKKQLTTALSEQALFMDKEIIKSLKSHIKAPVAALNQQIIEIEKEILRLIKKESNIHRLYKIITSIDGVGLITAAYIIVTTNEFVSISEPKKFACYSGVVPFEHSSGISFKGKTRVSHRANKTLKTLLHLSAWAATRVEGDIQDYYKRKVAEGKNKMCVLNAIRNKLVLRIFACVKQDRMFEKKYSYSLA